MNRIALTLALAAEIACAAFKAGFPKMVWSYAE